MHANSRSNGDLADAWRERAEQVSEALTRFYEAVRKVTEDWLDALAPVIQRLRDIIWQAYLQDGAVYGDTEDGMWRWWHETTEKEA